MRRSIGALALALALPAACTMDFDRFEFVDGGAGGTSGVSGKGGKAGSATTGGSGGKGGSTGGSDGSGGTAGAGDASTDASADGASDAGCGSGMKSCGGTCVELDDPAFGCTEDGCTPCAVANGTPACSSGACAVGSCDTNFDDCDESATNGCEANLQTSAAHCGECDLDCQPVGASACIAGSCEPDPCPAGFGECDGDLADYCETALSTSISHCGACGDACSSAHGTASCSGGNCAIACSANYGDCDGNVANGCETALTTDVNHCGACGRACSATRVAARACSSGTCSSSCDFGFANCTRPAAPAADNGCELNATADSGNCGGCSNSCTQQSTGGGGLVCGAQSSTSCSCDGDNARCRQGASGGTCDATTDLCRCATTTCVAGEACMRVGGVDVCACNQSTSCGGAAGVVCCDNPSGCRDLTSDPASCGACGRACAPGFDCQGSQCRCTASSQCRSGGVCNTTTGRCSCAGAICGQGERCVATNVCG
jgi:hypothetical protein